MKLLSHYTQRAGLEGIARDGALRATNFLDLEDTSEFFYAWSQIRAISRDLARQEIKDVEDQLGLTTDGLLNDNIAELKHSLDAMEGYGHLYVTSFATGVTEDHDKRGHLTLWARYGDHRGYCLQFDRDDLRRLLRLDAQSSSYEWVGMANVIYGLDQGDREFREICFQVAQASLMEIAKRRGDTLVVPKHELMWAPPVLARRVLEFCATHKDPCFEDEREVRIYAYPAAEASARFLTGLACRKEIRRTESGARFILIGEHWEPGLAPHRVLVGTKANRNIEPILRQFSQRPEVAYADMPLA